MVKKTLLTLVSLLSLLLIMSCEGKTKTPKVLHIPTAIVTVDTLAHLSDDMQCHVHVDFTYLKGKKYEVINDSLLRMGLLQPDYFSISHNRLKPQIAISSFVRQYVKEYMEIARLIRQKEKKRSQLIGELTIKTELKAAADDYITAISHIAINNGNGRLTQYTIIRNFNPKNGHLVNLGEVCGKEYKEELTKKIIGQLAEQEGLDDDDFIGLQRKGYFIGIDPYPTENFILTDDSLVFIYTPGEINQHEVRVAIEKNMIEIIKKYFPQLSAKQIEQFTALNALYHDWNAKINVISRKDIDNLYEHHVLHSLAIAKRINFREGTNILDFGTGGGFPGIPLAILFPEANFKLIDGTGKKVRVAQEVANAIGLENVLPAHLRGEEEKGKFDFIVSRAVMPLPDLIKIVKKNIACDQHNVLPNGVIVLKGGNLEGELMPYKRIAEKTELSLWFEEDWFKEKYLIYVPR